LKAAEGMPPQYGYGENNGATVAFGEKMDANHEKMLANMASLQEKIEARNSELDAIMKR
jgi:hypothetical protein